MIFIFERPHYKPGPLLLANDLASLIDPMDSVSVKRPEPSRPEPPPVPSPPPSPPKDLDDAPVSEEDLCRRVHQVLEIDASFCALARSLITKGNPSKSAGDPRVDIRELPDDFPLGRMRTLVEKFPILYLFQTIGEFRQTLQKTIRAHGKIPTSTESAMPSVEGRSNEGVSPKSDTLPQPTTKMATEVEDQCNVEVEDLLSEIDPALTGTNGS